MMACHNLYQIISVVTALVAMESARLAIDSISSTGLVANDKGPTGVNDHAQQAKVVPGSE